MLLLALKLRNFVVSVILLYSSRYSDLEGAALMLFLLVMLTLCLVKVKVPLSSSESGKNEEY